MFLKLPKYISSLAQGFTNKDLKYAPSSFRPWGTDIFRILVCKASWLSRPPGAKINEKQHLRIQEGHFLKIA